MISKKAHLREVYVWQLPVRILHWVNAFSITILVYSENFKTATNQAPRYSQPGEPALERTVILQLKLLADVGLVGFPNAGKSTLLSVVSAAKPKIANYPFTTLEPNLGIVSYRDNRSFVMADIPGIIEGASEGKGLGLRFLRHIERNSVLLFMVPSDSEDIHGEYKILLNELKQYNPELLDKKRLLAISKSDFIDKELMEEIEKEVADAVAGAGASGPQDMGKVMGVLKGRLAGRADMSAVSALVKKALTKA